MVVVCALDRHRVVVPAGRVEVIGEQQDAERDGRITDLAAILGVPPPPGPRRALRVLAGEAARWLVIGGAVSVRTLPAAAFRTFPEWLDGVLALVPFAGLVAIDGGFAFELDLTRLPRSEAA